MSPRLDLPLQELIAMEAAPVPQMEQVCWEGERCDRSKGELKLTRTGRMVHQHSLHESDHASACRGPVLVRDRTS